MIVIDASAAIELLINSSAGIRVANRVFAEGESLHAPHLIDVEVAQVLRKYVRLRDMAPDRASQALEDFVALPIHRYPHTELLPRIWDLRHGLAAYDATYVALAEALDATLLTCDTRLRNSHGHSARIQVA